MLFSPNPMHIPDGFLSVTVAISFWAISLLVVGYALERVNTEVRERQIPLMGVLAACIFAGQMLNFSVTGGTSGHLVGATLAAILLGPWAAILVMTCVIGVQALIFQDGGLLALGANIFNMGIVGVAVTYFAYRSMRTLLGKRPYAMMVSGLIAGWLSIFVASLACAVQLALSGTSPANIAIPAMAGIHTLIGIGEGLITAGALAFLQATRPDLLKQETCHPVGERGVWIAGLGIAGVLTLASPLASAHPDGLEWVAGQHKFLDKAQAPLHAVLSDYALPGIPNEPLATILAGGVGVILVLGAVLAVSASKQRREKTASH